MIDHVNTLQNFGVKDCITLDTEFVGRDGEHVVPVALCARSLFTGQEWRLPAEAGQVNPLPAGDDILYVTFAGPAEWGYYLAMDWDLPSLIIDLYAERCMATRDQRDHLGKAVKVTLLTSLMHYRLDAMSVVEKTENRDLILRGAPYTPEEQARILTYCMQDVVATEALFVAMLNEAASRIVADMEGPEGFAARAAIVDGIFNDRLRKTLTEWMARGHHTRDVAYEEWNGIPIDRASYERFQLHHKELQNRLIRAVEAEHSYGVYVPKKNGNMSFNKAKFNEMVEANGLGDDWPRTASGKDFQSADDVFKDMATRFPALKPLYDVRKFTTTLRHFKLFIGADDRARVYPNPWWTNTGRHNPRNSNFPFTLPKWVRPFIKPAAGRALVYSDLKAAEIGIAAALSGDVNMQTVYKNSLLPGGDDCYTGYGKQAGAIPPDGTKASHPRERAFYKVSFLAKQYGQSPDGMAKKNGLPLRVAEAVHKKHERIYAHYWAWIDNEVCTAGVLGVMSTNWGWTRRVTEDDAESNALLNFPIQAGCGEILRRACGYMAEEGLVLCACIHDAVLLESAIEDATTVAETAERCWKQASRDYLYGFELGADAKIVAYPDRWLIEDADDIALWTRIQTLLDEIEKEEVASSAARQASS